ncbi:hypothetical protein ATANTOWER_001691 [Ataeniobius toweri]|uniref:Uncharacterized protein n=1 Tax=Ataeniobius toweri TaxID=208326 RepID=A0ABU7BFZ1_9TELE|nr:hypothetical protein [Ataeniobius toweri]
MHSTNLTSIKGVGRTKPSARHVRTWRNFNTTFFSFCFSKAKLQFSSASQSDNIIAESVGNIGICHQKCRKLVWPTMKDQTHVDSQCGTCAAHSTPSYVLPFRSPACSLP